MYHRLCAAGETPAFETASPPIPLNIRFQDGIPRNFLMKDFRGHRFFRFSLGGTVGLNDDVQRLATWLLAHRGCISIGNQRITEPRGLVLVSRQKDHVVISLVATCQLDFEEAAKQLGAIAVDLGEKT